MARRPALILSLGLIAEKPVSAQPCRDQRCQNRLPIAEERVKERSLAFAGPRSGDRCGDVFQPDDAVRQPDETIAGAFVFLRDVAFVSGGQS